MSLDLSSFKKAVASLESAVNIAGSSPFMEGLTTDEREVIKAGVIQNFEFTFELSWKFIQRWIRLNKTPEDADPRTRKDLFRQAARFGLIEQPVRWFEYGDARNITSHTYNESKAAWVFEVAMRFIHDAKYLLRQLEALND